MADLSTPAPKDAPIMLAWEAFKETSEYVNAHRWARQEAHTEGSMWFAFLAGWQRSQGSDESTQLANPAGSPTDRDEPRGWVVVERWHSTPLEQVFVNATLYETRESAEVARVERQKAMPSATITVEPIGHQTGDMEREPVGPCVSCGSTETPVGEWPLTSCISCGAPWRNYDTQARGAETVGVGDCVLCPSEGVGLKVWKGSVGVCGPCYIRAHPGGTPETEPTYAPPTPESLRAMAAWFRENAPEVRTSSRHTLAWMSLDSIAYYLEQHRRPARGDGGEADG